VIGFLHPWALLGIGAAGLPLLLHLLARREPPTVEFPAVRYLVETARQHQRRLKVQNYLLLVLRTLLILALVLAAAGPSPSWRVAPGHTPSTLVLIVDNSLSSGAVIGGSPVLAELRSAARRTLERATPEDDLWLLAADGTPRKGGPDELSGLLRDLIPTSRRMDLGAAVRTAGELLGGQRRPGEIAVFSDFQATALSAAQPAVPPLLVRSQEPAPPNAGLVLLDPGPQPWTPEGGRVRVEVAGGIPHPVLVSLHWGDRPPRQALVEARTPVELAVPAVPSGWWVLTAELAPDELKGDDRRVVAVRVAPVAGAAWRPDEPYLAAACGVLVSGGRLHQGDEVSLGFLGPGASVVEPPADPARIGALNRALATRGVAWRFGALRIEASTSDSGALLGRERIARRYALEWQGGQRTGVLATVAGNPWMVQAGRVVLLGSRLDPEWTSLPLSAGFVPLVDVLANRIVQGEIASLQGAPGDPILMPDLVTQVRQGDRGWTVEGGAAFRPAEPGVYFLLAGRDTVGALAVNPDPRESALARASDRELEGLWPQARIVNPPEAPDAVFRGAVRSDLRGPLLWTALLLGVCEVLIASVLRRKA